MMYVIYPDEERKFVIGLYLARTDRQYAKLRKWMKFPAHRESAGCFKGYLTNYVRKFRGKILVGYIMLRLPVLKDPYYRAEVVAHECMHATAQYLRRRKKWSAVVTDLGAAAEDRLREAGTPLKIPEELCCYTLGRLVEQVTRALKQERKYK
jgi:hypothetical protein